MAETVTFANGKIICGRWKVLARLGTGGCGSVYKVEDTQRKGYIAALKAEAILENDSGVLKLEAAVLKKLADRKNVIRLLQSGKRLKYSFIVITICGSDLMSLKKRAQEGLSENTILRIGIYALYGIKQLHEIGFVHRDVKPGNMMNGANGRDRRIIFLIDYGMVRNFVVRDPKGISMRKPRKNVLLRGTLRYCSLGVHRRLEQECPGEFISIANYLRTLNYQDRPDYYKLYNWFMDAMKREKYSFSDKYEWEEECTTTSKLDTAVDYSVREKTTKKSLDGFEKEALLYTNIHENNFKEVILTI